MQNRPVDKVSPFFSVGEEDLLAFRRRRKFQDAYIKMHIMKEMRDEVMKQVF
jgi:hypothetical protein